MQYWLIIVNEFLTEITFIRSALRLGDDNIQESAQGFS